MLASDQTAFDVDQELSDRLILSDVRRISARGKLRRVERDPVKDSFGSRPERCGSGSRHDFRIAHASMLKPCCGPSRNAYRPAQLHRWPGIATCDW